MTAPSTWPRERLVATVDSRLARSAAALAPVLGCSWLVVLLQHQDGPPDWQAGGRLAWSLTVLAGVLFIARGIFLGRPVTTVHATVAGAALLVGIGAYLLSLDLVGNVVIACAGLILMWPTTARPHAETLQKAWALVDATHSDPLAPFVMDSHKSWYFSTDATAMLAYRTRIGFAVVSGDPIGDATQFSDLVRSFTAMCHTRGWRILVLGCSQKRLSLWITPAVALRPQLRAVPIGRDVVIDVAHFDMAGRKYRNLRQAVRRTRNAGVTTEVIAERDLDDATLAELTEVLDSARSRLHTERGFSMILDGALQGRYPGVLLMVGRDRFGRVQAVQRYVQAGGGNDISLDLPWRRPGAPNGIDERLSVDMVAWSREHGARRLSLAFAAFPEIFDDQHRGFVRQLFYVSIHLGDRLIRLESLYRYLSKYHAMGDSRYVLVSLRHLLPALWVMLTLEFLPHRRHAPQPPSSGEP